MVFANSDKQKNKAAYDRLYTHMAEVAKALGRTLQWKRLDDAKYSRVFIQLDGVSIEKEADWPQMAQFLAEWSKKFYDVLVPYIKE